MNDPEGFYPSESDEPFWKIRRDMFKDIFRFRMEQVHRLISASVFLLRYGIGLWNSVALLCEILNHTVDVTCYRISCCY